LLALGGLIIWSMIGNYLGLLGLPALSGADASTPIYLIGVAVLCVVPLAIVLAFFILPRWDMPGIDQPEQQYIAWLRPGVPAFAIGLCPWIDPIPIILGGTVLLVGFNAWTWSASSARRPAETCRYLLLQLPGAVLTVFWLVIWIEIWARATSFRFPQMGAPIQNVALWIIITIGWLLYVSIRRAGWRGTISALALVLSGLGLSNPGFPAVMAGALYMLNIGGGRVDIEASAQGPLLCDMGAFARHYYIRAGEAGCTFKGASQWIRMLRQREGPARIQFLRANRVIVASSSQPS
jgi:hypothetical protein